MPDKREEGLSSAFGKGGTGGIAMLPSHQVKALKSYHKEKGKEAGDKTFKFYKEYWGTKKKLHEFKKKIKEKDKQKVETEGL